MHITKVVTNHQLQHVLESKPVQSGYILDERGNEVQITTAMIRSVCHQLLKKCRHIQN